jgi:diaminopropionate ammonia-lyase
MQGYGVLMLEACELMSRRGLKPTHLIIQAGVGAFAGSAQGFASNFYGNDCPVTFVVEASAADCHYRSAVKGDGSRVSVGGDLNTIMAGLACGEPGTLSWEILKNESQFFVTIDDCDAARGMRVLGAPLPGDQRIISGESGASGMGFLMDLLTNPDLAELRKQAGIDRNSRILLVSTEGDTDPEGYKKVIWDGKYPL